jgi:hypothetical protein
MSHKERALNDGGIKMEKVKDKNESQILLIEQKSSNVRFLSDKHGDTESKHRPSTCIMKRAKKCKHTKEVWNTKRKQGVQWASEPAAE